MVVFFVRHAKSSWDQSNISDLDRPLNQRGLETAPKMAAFIENLYPGIKPHFISSPANRAQTTANFFAKQYNVSIRSIEINETLYYGDENNYIDCLSNLSNNCKYAFVFGHNPIIEILVSKIGNPYHGPVPTCAVFCCKNGLNTWQSLKFQDLMLTDHFFPKLISKT